MKEEYAVTPDRDSEQEMDNKMNAITDDTFESEISKLEITLNCIDENDLPDISQCSYELEEGELIDSILENNEEKSCLKTLNCGLESREIANKDKPATSDNIESTDGEITDSDNEFQILLERFNKNNKRDYSYASGITTLGTKNKGGNKTNDYYGSLRTPILCNEKVKCKESACKDFWSISSDLASSHKVAKTASKSVKPKKKKRTRVKSCVKKISSGLDTSFIAQKYHPHDHVKEDSLFTDSAKEGACSVRLDGENIIITRSLGKRLPQIKENNVSSQAFPKLELKDCKTNIHKKGLWVPPELDISKELENSLLCSEESGDGNIENSEDFKKAIGIVSSTPIRLNTDSLKRWEPQFLPQKESFLVLDEFGEFSDQEISTSNCNGPLLKAVNHSPTITTELSPKKIFCCNNKDRVVSVPDLPAKTDSGLNDNEFCNTVNNLEITISNDNSVNLITVIDNKNITLKSRSRPTSPNMFAVEENVREIIKILERPESTDFRSHISISVTQTKEEQSLNKVETMEMPGMTELPEKIDIKVLPNMGIEEELKPELEESKDNVKNIVEQHTIISVPIVKKEPENMIVEHTTIPVPILKKESKNMVAENTTMPVPIVKKEPENMVAYTMPVSILKKESENVVAEHTTMSVPIVKKEPETMAADITIPVSILKKESENMVAEHTTMPELILKKETENMIAEHTTILVPVLKKESEKMVSEYTTMPVPLVKKEPENMIAEHTTMPVPIVKKESENIIVNQQDSAGKNSEENVQKMVSKIEEDYVSNNPEENADNFNPEWEVLRKLETDGERYRAMRKRWKNLVIPDPNQELTFRTWRMNNYSAPSTSATFSQSTSNSSIDTIGQRKTSENNASSIFHTENRKRLHSADSAIVKNEGPNAKRARTQSCTAIYDTKLKQLKKNLQNERERIDNEEQLALLQLSFKQSEELNNLQRMCPSHTRNAAMQELISEQMGDVEQIHLQYDKARHVVEEKSFIKLRNLQEACDEVKAFHMFYRGLDPMSENGDTLYLSDAELQELWNTEHLYEQYKKFYSV